MAYCDIDDVRRLNPKRTYNASSKPTATQVTSMCTDVANEIDTVLQGRGLTTPVTTPTEFVAFLLLVNATGAAAYAEAGMLPEASGIGSTPQDAKLWSKYQAMLKFLGSGKLPVDTEASAEAFSFLEQNRNTETEPEENYPWQAPKFGKGKVF